MTQHLAWPASLDPATGSLAVVARDSDAGAAQEVRLLLATRIGERLVTPSLGISDPTYVGVDVQEAVNAAAAWVPRASVDVAAGVVGDGQQTAHVDVGRDG